MALSNGQGEESAAVPLRVCALGSGDDPGSAPRAIRLEVERGQCGKAVEATWVELPAALVSGDGARPEASAAVAGGGVSPQPPAKSPSPGGHRPWQRKRGAVVPPFWEELERTRANRRS